MRETRSPLASDGLPVLRHVIDTHELRAKKSLGQNFLLDLNLTAKIAQLAGPIENRVIVEVGPGPGGLTRALLSAGAQHVIAIERDDRCLAALEQISEHWPGNLTVIPADALTMNWKKVLPPQFLHFEGQAQIVANLPYGIASKLLTTWLETDPWPPWFSGMALMFQKEVAERIVAHPSTKAYGRLSVISQWRCHCEIVMSLGPEAFTPAPKVASAVVRFTPRDRLSPACTPHSLSLVSQAIFGQRRKMLRASLKSLSKDPEGLLQPLGIDPTLRGEALSVDQIASIALAVQAPSKGRITDPN